MVTGFHFPLFGVFIMALSFTAFLGDDPIRVMVGNRCDNLVIIKETKNTITLAIRPGTLASERLKLHRGVWSQFTVCSHPVTVLYKQRKSGGFQLCFDATMHVKIYRPGFIGLTVE